MGSVTDFLFGSKGGIDQLPAMNQGQTNLLNQLTQLLGGSGAAGQGVQQSLSALMGMISGQDRSWEDPYRQSFSEQTLPMLAERFAGMGGPQGGGALSSSGFGQALGSAGSQLESQLAMMRDQRQQSAIGQMLGFSQAGMSQALGAQPFMYQARPASTGFLPQLASSAVGGLMPPIFDLIKQKYGGK